MKTKRKLGIFSALFVALGATIGTGIVLTYGSILSATGSIIISLVGWIIAGFLIIPQMMIQGEMVSAYPEAGGPYAFFKQAKMKAGSFMYGWCYAIIGWPISIAFRAFVTFQFLDFLIKFFINSNESYFNLWILRSLAAVTIIVFGVINYYSLKISACVNNILTVTKVVLLLLIIVVAFTAFDSNNFNLKIIQNIDTQGPLALLWFKGLTISVALAIWSYNGINTIAYMAPEFKNSQKVLPLIMILGTIIIIVIYTLFVVAIGGLLSASEAISKINEGKEVNDIVLIALEKLKLKWVTTLLVTLIFLLSLSTVFTFVKVAPRLSYAMAQDGLIFQGFGRLNQYGTPGIAIIFNTLSAAVLSFLPINTEFIVIYFTFGTAIMNFLISLLILKCWKNPDYQPIIKLKAPKLILTLSLLSCIIIAGSGFYTALSSISDNLWLLGAPLLSILSILSAYPVYYGWSKAQANKARKKVIQKT